MNADPVRSVTRICFVLGPALLVIAAVVSLLDIDRNSDRWYDNWVEGAILVPGMSIFVGALLGAALIVAERDRRLGTVLVFTSLLAAVAVGPGVGRMDGAALVAEGIDLDLLDTVYGEETPYQVLPLLPLIMSFFLTQLVLAVGLWRARDVPKFAPIFIALGAILFPVAQTSFEVIEPVYVAAVLCTLVGFGALARRPIPQVAYSASP